MPFRSHGRTLSRSGSVARAAGHQVGEMAPALYLGSRPQPAASSSGTNFQKRPVNSQIGGQMPDLWRVSQVLSNESGYLAVGHANGARFQPTHPFFRCTEERGEKGPVNNTHDIPVLFYLGQIQKGLAGYKTVLYHHVARGHDRVIGYDEASRFGCRFPDAIGPIKLRLNVMVGHHVLMAFIVQHDDCHRFLLEREKRELFQLERVAGVQTLR